MLKYRPLDCALRSWAYRSSAGATGRRGLRRTHLWLYGFDGGSFTEKLYSRRNTTRARAGSHAPAWVVGIVLDTVFIHNIDYQGKHSEQKRLFPYPGTHAWAFRTGDLNAFCAYLLRWQMVEGAPHNVRLAVPRPGAPVYAVNSRAIGDYIFRDGPAPALLDFDPSAHVVARQHDHAGWPWFDFRYAPPFQVLIQGADLCSMREHLVAAAQARGMCWPDCHCGRAPLCHRQRLDAMGRRHIVVERVAARMDVASYHSLIAAVLARSNCPNSTLRGERHWRAVAEIGLVLSGCTRGCDPLIVVLFALFHDAQHCNHNDPDHGHRGAALARELCADLPAPALETLAQACAEHTDGRITTDPTIGVCWDADRLNLWRVGRRPDPRRLSTHTAKKPGYIAWAQTVHAQPRDWDALYVGLARQMLL